MIKQRERLSNSKINQAEKLGQALDIPIEVALLLLRQNISTPEQAKVFFNPQYSDFHDPFLMKGMDEAVNYINKNIDENKKIAIFCDYDVDGTSACSLLYLYLKHQNADVVYYLPDRNTDGYGMNASAVQSMIDDNVSLVITVDCGITNIEETDMIKKAGIAVIITDHHECGEALPSADVILNPKQPDCDYPYSFLSGSGIAFKLLQALCGKEAMRYVDYAALGTIADIVPLTGENRIIAQMGLKKMNTEISVGIGLIRPYVLPESKTVTEYHIGFGFGPRINAAGRMESAHLAMTVLLAEEPTIEAKKAAERLNQLNDERKEICDQIMMDAMDQIVSENMLNQVGAIFAIGNWEPGVIGICASKLVQRFGRPVLIFAKKGDEAVCSARSIPNINIYEALSEFRSYYVKFGGHHMAAGLTIKYSDYDALKSKVNTFFKKNTDSQLFVPKVFFDIEVGDKIDPKLAKSIEKLAPFGQDNPKPKLLFRNRAVNHKQYFGRQGKVHFKFNLNTNGAPLSAIKFFFDQKDDALKHADVVGTASVSDFSGKSEILIDYFEASSLENGENKPIFLMQNTLKRLLQIQKNETKADRPLQMAENEILALVNAEPFGTAIVVEDVCQLRVLINSKIIQDLISEGKLVVRMSNVYDVPINAIMISKQIDSAIKPYQQIVRLTEGNHLISDHSKKVITLPVNEVAMAYKKAADDFFVDRQVISHAYVWFKRMVEQNTVFKDENQLYVALAGATGMRLEQAVAAGEILQDIDLIELDKSDMIRGKIIEYQDKKDLEASQYYLALNKGR